MDLGNLHPIARRGKLRARKIALGSPGGNLSPFELRKKLLLNMGIMNLCISKAKPWNRRQKCEMSKVRGSHFCPSQFCPYTIYIYIYIYL